MVGRRVTLIFTNMNEEFVGGRSHICVFRIPHCSSRKKNFVVCSLIKRCVLGIHNSLVSTQFQLPSLQSYNAFFSIFLESIRNL